jgi:hypothetical protein
MAGGCLSTTFLGIRRARTDRRKGNAMATRDDNGKQKQLDGSRVSRQTGYLTTQQGSGSITPMMP